MAKKRNRWFIRLMGLTLVLFIFVIVAIVAADEPIPDGIEGEQADHLAREMMQQVNTRAWDTTEIIVWNHGGIHRHIWDRKRHLAQVNWSNNKVQIDLTTREGKAWKDGVMVDEDKSRKLVAEAYSFWVNDAFWLNPIAKCFEDGVSRKAVRLKDGGRGLLISFSSGGLTPGDKYLWILNDLGLPEKWKMWVGIIPIGGLEMSWEGWVKLPTGALISTRHEQGFYTLILDAIQAGSKLHDVFPNQDPFASLFQDN